MRTRLFAICLLLLVVAPGTGAQRPDADVSQLPVRRVVLYKSGVGFFEHLGSVTGSATVAVQFTTAQLNDALQSLTTLDLDGGSVANISYNSIAPLDQRLAALRLQLGGDADRLQFYRALRGAHVNVTAGTSAFGGRVLSVEQQTRTKGEETETSLLLSVVTDEGSVKVVELTPAVTVHVDDRDLRDELSSYLGILSSNRGEDVRRMLIAAAGSGTRRLLVSYISEVPVWKSTYRLILPPDGQRPVLQGWAVVDNTIGQDWTNVELSLVAGAPQSFIQPISQPYYLRRPTVAVSGGLVMQPQTHAATLTVGDGIVRGTITDTTGAALPGVTVRLLGGAAGPATAISNGQGRYELHAPEGAYQLQAELSGFNTVNLPVTLAAGAPRQSNLSLSVGSVSEAVMVSSGRGRGAAAGGMGLPAKAPAFAAPAPAPPPALPSAMDRLAALPDAAANAQDLGDLFEYTLKQPVTIKKNESALVPILNAAVDAERVSIWNRGISAGRPLRGVWLTNSSNLTLDGGSFSVVDGDTFAGQGLIDPLKPGEKRLVSYGADLAMTVKAARGDMAGKYIKIVAHDGFLIASEEDRAEWKYTARNEDAAPRTLIIEHPMRAGWKPAADPAAAETTVSAARYRLTVPAKKDATLTVSESHAGDVRFALTDVANETIIGLVRNGASEASLRKALQPLIDKRAEVAAAEARLSAIDGEVEQINGEQERIRNNMGALKGSAEEKTLIQRYTRQLNDQEDRLAALDAEQKKVTSERDARRTELNAIAAKLTFEIAG